MPLTGNLLLPKIGWTTEAASKLHAGFATVHSPDSEYQTKQHLKKNVNSSFKEIQKKFKVKKKNTSFPAQNSKRIQYNTREISDRNVKY